MIQYLNLILFEIALVYFNTNIFRGIQMSHERTRRKNTQRASEMNLAAILFCIVVVFIICHFPRILLNVHELIMLDDMMECGESGNYRLLIWFHLYFIVLKQYVCRNNYHSQVFSVSYESNYNLKQTFKDFVSQTDKLRNSNK